MDEKIKKFLDEQGEDRPIMAIRHVGSRIEIWPLGTSAPLVMEVKDSERVYTFTELNRMTVVQLRDIAAALGLVVGGRKKATLVANIISVQADR